MYFKRLRLRNFGPFEDFAAEFKQGSIGVFGANGAGKSTICNAMYACLTNDFSRFGGLKVDCIRNTMEKGKDAWLEGLIEHNGTEFTVTRYLTKAKESSCFEVTGKKPVTNANKVEEEIENILKLDRKMLDLYVFKTQDRIYDFLSTTPTERAKAFAVLCRTEKCEYIWDYLGKFLNKDAEVNVEIIDNSDELTQQIAAHEAQKLEIETSIKTEEELMMNDVSLESAKTILNNHRRVCDLIKERDNEQTRIEETTQELSDATVRRDKRQKTVKVNQQEMDDRAKDAEQARALLKEWERYKKQKSKRKALKEEKALLEKQQTETREPKVPDGYSKDAGLKLSNLINDAETELKKAKEVVKVFSKSSVVECPTCGTEVEHLEKHLTAMKKLVAELPDEISDLKDKWSAINGYESASRVYREWKAGFDARYKANTEAMKLLDVGETPDVDEDEARQSIDHYDLAKNNYTVAVVDIGKSEATVTRLTAELKTIKRRYKEIVDEIEAKTQSEEKVDKVRKRMDEHTTAVNNMATLRGELKGLKRFIESKTEEMDKLRAKMKRSKRVRRAAKIVEAVRDLMHRTCLPQDVAQANLSAMEGDINEGLGWFGSPFWIESDTDLNFLAHKPGAPPQASSTLSTGQKVIVAMAFWPAVASLWQADLGMLALDEPTANLDENNRKLLAEALGILTAQVRGKRQLIMVSHDQNLRSAFDQVIDVG